MATVLNSPPDNGIELDAEVFHDLNFFLQGGAKMESARLDNIEHDEANVLNKEGKSLTRVCILCSIPSNRARSTKYCIKCCAVLCTTPRAFGNRVKSCFQIFHGQKVLQKRAPPPRKKRRNDARRKQILTKKRKQVEEEVQQVQHRRSMRSRSMRSSTIRKRKQPQSNVTLRKTTRRRRSNVNL